MIRLFLFSSLIILGGISGCSEDSAPAPKTAASDSNKTTVESHRFVEASFETSKSEQPVLLGADQWVRYKIDIPKAGRYKIELKAQVDDTSMFWLEDYVKNTDERTYDITGKMIFLPGQEKTFVVVAKMGAPLNAGTHDIKLHCSKGLGTIASIAFSRIVDHMETPKTYTQNMQGKEWELVWSDEFEGEGLPDTSLWSYNIGNWGWGNNEEQYYTTLDTQNARLSNGHLIIEAHKDSLSEAWSSARLTTQGKESFVYGKIEFRAKVPTGRGTWAAGWLLGDAYTDEISWPYCGEIDVLECVGFEIDDSTGNGINHATCHTRSYYFKQGNQIGADTTVKAMNSEFHTYAIEWYPHVIYALLDGKRYYTYDKNKDELEWPFHNPQNIILNLAIGGGWGGAKGVDERLGSQQYILDYVRVYALK